MTSLLIIIDLQYIIEETRVYVLQLSFVFQLTKIFSSIEKGHLKTDDVSVRQT